MKIKEIKIVNQDQSTEIANIGADAINVDYDDTTVKAELDKLNTVDNTLELKLNKKPYYYDNVAAMKADNKLKNGDCVQTLGYYSANDGGGATYQIVNDTSLVDDGGSVHAITNGLRAKLIVDGTINVKQFGAKGDNTNDDTQAINRAITSGFSEIYFPKGIYKVTNTLTIDSSVKFTGYSNLSFPYNGSYLKYYSNTPNSSLINATTNCLHLELEKMGFLSDTGNFTSANYNIRPTEPYNPYTFNKTVAGINGITCTKKLKMVNCYISGFSGYGVQTKANSVITDLFVSKCGIGIDISGYDPIITNAYITLCENGIVVEQGSASSVFIYNLWIDQIVEYGIKGASIIGIINGIIDHVGYAGIYATGNLKQLMLDMRVNRCGMYYAGTDKDEISNGELMKGCLIYADGCIKSQLKVTTEYRDIGTSPGTTANMTPKNIFTGKLWQDTLLYCNESDDYNAVRLINSSSNCTLISQKGIKRLSNLQLTEIYELCN